jgi:hypothetical protein
MTNDYMNELKGHVAHAIKTGNTSGARAISVCIGVMEIARLLRDHGPMTSFSQLHDVCDANTLGGLCDDVVSNAFDCEEDWIDFANLVQNELNDMLRRGNITAAAKE